MSRTFKTPFAASGDKNAVPAAVQGDGSLSVAQGWGPDYEKAYGDPASKDIKRADMNGLLHDITEAIGEMQAQGVATWSTDGKPYAKGVLVYHASKLWQSTVATNNATPGTTGWIEVSIADLATSASAKTFGAGLDDIAGVVSVKYGTTAGTAAQGNDARIAGAALKANNLSDLANASTARANLGLGAAAQKAVTSSTTDTTVGRVVQVGDYGLGLPVALTGSDNLNSISVSGLYRWGASGAPANAPAGVTAATMYVSSWTGDANSIAQLIISSTGRMITRTKHNTSSSWVVVEQSAELLSSTGQSTTQAMTQKAVTDALSSSGALAMIGIPLPIIANSPPPGMIACNGALLNRSVYNVLWTRANTLYRVVPDGSWASQSGAYSDGDGISTFRVPDLRGEFLRGMDVGRGIDPGGSRQAGSLQGDELKSHTHEYMKHTSTGGGGGSTLNQNPALTQTSATGGAETRPRNVAVLWCMYY